MIASSAARVAFGSAPRSASLAPSSRITASVPSATDQSSRANPPAAVSPDTPAFSIWTESPLAFSARSSFAGSASGAAKPETGAERIAEHDDPHRALRQQSPWSTLWRAQGP